MTGKPNINTTACREAARYYVRETEKRDEPPSRLIRDTIPGLCDEVDHLRAVVANVEAAIERGGKLHKTWRKDLEMVVPVADLRAALAGGE